jgi:hypothetical protein
MDSFKSIIDAFGEKRLAEALGIADSHVRTMRARDSIPPEYWSDVVDNQPRDLKPRLSLSDLAHLRKSRFAEATQ